MVLKGNPMSGRQTADALSEEHGRDPVRAGLKLGITLGQITASKGPRNSIIHTLTDECAGVRGQCAPRSEFECASASIARAHSPLTEDTVFDPARRALDSDTPAGLQEGEL